MPTIRIQTFYAYQVNTYTKTHPPMTPTCSVTLVRLHANKHTCLIWSGLSPGLRALQSPGGSASEAVANRHVANRQAPGPLPHTHRHYPPPPILAPEHVVKRGGGPPQPRLQPTVAAPVCTQSTRAGGGIAPSSVRRGCCGLHPRLPSCPSSWSVCCCRAQLSAVVERACRPCAQNTWPSAVPAI